MIRISGQDNGSHDPKLKLPLVASPGAREAFERTGGVVTGDIADLRKALADARAEIVTLTARVDDQDAKIAVLLASLTKVTEVTGSVTRGVTRDVTAAVTRDADTRSAADRQRAYRERKKAKA